MSGRRWSAVEVAFVARVRQLARDADIAAALGRTLLAVRHYREGHGLTNRRRDPLRPVLLSPAAVAEAWERHQRGAELSEGLLFWKHHVTPSGRRGVRPCNAGQAWLPGDIEELEDLLGRVPMREMARLLGRGYQAVRRQLWRLRPDGTRWAHEHFRYTIRGLALALAGEGQHVSWRTVREWCMEGRVRSFHEGRSQWSRRIILREDAEWLLANYRYYERFPKHPGAEQRRAA